MVTDIFDKAGLPPREQVVTWINIKKNIGDKVHGVFMGWWLSPSRQSGFKDQIGIALKQEDGTVVGVTLGDTTYIRGRLEPSQVGDEMGIKYEGDKDTGKPQKAKIVKIYNPAMEDRRKKGELKVTAAEVAPASKVEEGEDDSDLGF